MGKALAGKLKNKAEAVLVSSLLNIFSIQNKLSQTTHHKKLFSLYMIPSIDFSKIMYVVTQIWSQFVLYQEINVLPKIQSAVATSKTTGLKFQLLQHQALTLVRQGKTTKTQ